MKKIRNIEELSTDLLNDDFIRIFQPIFFVQQILGLLRVNIKYRYPTVPSTWYYLYGNVFWILNSCCVIYFFLRCEDGFDSQYANSALKFGVLLNGIYCALLLCRNNLQKGNNIGHMYVKLQKIERCLNMKISKSFNKQLSKLSKLMVISNFFVIIAWIILFKTVFMKKMCVALIFTTLTSIGLHMEMAQVYFILHLITTRVNYINDILLQASSNNPLKNSIGDGKLFLIMNSYYEDKEVQASRELVSTMHGIFETLAEFTKLYQFSIFCFICQVLAWNLVAIQYLVTSLEEQRTADFDLMLSMFPLLLLKQSIMMVLCLKAEALSTKLDISRKFCIDIVSSSFVNGESRSNAKQIILLVEGRRSLSIYNIYTLGTRLPLHLLAITASYTIVLLQFALL